MSGRKDYEERRENRIYRLQNKAYKKKIESNAHGNRSEKLSGRFYMGQPILVGHHSEAGARTAQKRMHNATKQSIELQEKSDYYADKAEAAAKNTAISSDDPNAPAKLREKIEELEHKQSEMKAANAYWRKNKTMKGFPGLSDESAAAMDERMKTAYSWVQKNGPFEDWRLSNNNAQIRTAKKRLETLATVDEMPDEVIPFDGGEIKSDSETNRIIVRHREKPEREIIDKLKSYGFRWSPQAKVWQRLRNKSALYAAMKICGIQIN